MRIWIGISGLLLVLAIAAMLARNQLSSVSRATKPAAAASASTPPPPQGEDAVRLPGGSDPAQLAAQYRQALDAALQKTARPVEDDAK